MTYLLLTSREHAFLFIPETLQYLIHSNYPAVTYVILESRLSHYIIINFKIKVRNTACLHLNLVHARKLFIHE